MVISDCLSDCGGFDSRLRRQDIKICARLKAKSGVEVIAHCHSKIRNPGADRGTLEQTGVVS